ncbi:MAG: glycosyltransferase family A protein [Nitrososphaerales archaeon]
MRVFENQISCILPTRGQTRKPLLFKCLSSFYDLASSPKQVEFIIVTDLDDRETRQDIETFLLDLNQDVKLIVRNRDLSNHSVNYVNYACQCSSGNIIWGLNDEVECLTSGWDDILKDKMDCNHPMYGLIDCNTKSKISISLLENYGGSFPVLTRVAAEKINGLLPKEINMWGADRELYLIFKRFKNIVDLTKDIKIKNHSYHSCPEEYSQDELFSTGTNHSFNGELNDKQINVYLDNLNSV